MQSIRNYMRTHPLAGWTFASLLALFSAYMVFARLNPKNETKALTELVTIRASDTGETWTMPRGAMEKQLYERPFPVNQEEGLPSPTTGKRTGFPIDAWKETVARVNAERASAGQGEAGKPAAPPPPAPKK